MQTDQLSSQHLRRLVETRLERPLVVSAYLSLDPSEFATPPARSAAVRSLLDEAQRRVKELEEELPHDDRVALGQDVERMESFLRGASAEAAHAIAAFCSAPADLFEAFKLPRPVESRVVIDGAPFVEPLAGMLATEAWCVVLVNRRTARIVRGSAEVLVEVEGLSEEVHGQHQAGGWSQARYERSVDKDATDHVKRTAELLSREYKRESFEHLLVGAPTELRHEVEGRLPAPVRERLEGFVDVDVEHASPDEIREAAASEFQRVRRRRERDALDRLIEGSRAGGRGAAGIDEVLSTLNERRVEILLLEEGFETPGSLCSTCGFLTTTEGGECPVDGGRLEPREDVVENAIELALKQAAEVMVVRLHDDLGSLGSIGAVLRF
ncbi:MAG: hypothetical protein M3N16_07810 [Actinomycetota bacterium]|nr:hypothetical protein [Actinomycetota bacterium]